MPKSVVGESVVIVVDLCNGIVMGFETGEILRFKLYAVLNLPTQIYQ